MASPKAEGRMIRKDISDSDKYASLTPEAAVLFAMLIPHYNAHGKMNGGPGYIKDEICPKVPYLSYENIPGLLKEISDKTNVKWFCNNGRWWLHSLNFLKEHQKLDSERKGPDRIPDYSATSPGIVAPEVEVEVEVKDKKEVEVVFFNKSESQNRTPEPQEQTQPPDDGSAERSAAAWRTLEAAIDRCRSGSGSIVLDDLVTREAVQVLGGLEGIAAMLARDGPAALEAAFRLRYENRLRMAPGP